MIAGDNADEEGGPLKEALFYDNRFKNHWCGGSGQSEATFMILFGR
jgi:hypothetical protein